MSKDTDADCITVLRQKVHHISSTQLTHETAKQRKTNLCSLVVKENVATGPLRLALSAPSLLAQTETAITMSGDFPQSKYEGKPSVCGSEAVLQRKFQVERTGHITQEWNKRGVCKYILQHTHVHSFTLGVECGNHVLSSGDGLLLSDKPLI